VKRRDIITLVGGAALWPIAAQGQQLAKLHRIAIISPSASIAEMSATGAHPVYYTFFKDLHRLGYVEGSNLSVERYSALGREDRHAELAVSAVRANPDVIVTFGSGLLRSLKSATDTIPIVSLMPDPVAYGFAESLTRPGGNITGIGIEAGLEIGESVSKSCGKSSLRRRR
jgi:putative ABC transport system substrate-binding protein